MSLSYHEQAYILDAFNITPRYLDDTLKKDNLYVENMVSQINPQTFNFIKSIPLIANSLFWTSNFSFPMICFYHNL